MAELVRDVSRSGGPAEFGEKGRDSVATTGTPVTTVDFSTKRKYFLVGAVAGAAIVSVVGAFVWGGLLAGDRPPIIVKGGSVLIENQPYKGKATGPGWADDGSDWKSDQQNAIDVSKYLVGVVGGVSGTCEDLE